MNKILCLLILTCVAIVSVQARTGPSDRTGPVPGKFIVKLRPDASPSRLAQALGRDASLRALYPGALRGGVVGADEIGRQFVVRVSTQALSEADIVRRIGRENIEYIEPDYFLEFFDYPQDALFPHQWYLHNEGQEYLAILRVEGPFNDERILRQGTPGKDINMSDVYESPPAETTAVVVAIVDTGVDVLHPELEGRLWRNEDEIPYNGIDDDHNGFVDDTLGYDVSGDSVDFFNPVGDNDPTDEDGHGSHLAGLVAANANTEGVAGVAPFAKIMPVKIRPNGTSAIGAAGVVYAVNAGAKVINISWGSPFESQVLRDALDFARHNGVLVCIAPGNTGDNTRYYPAGFDLDSTLVVGAGNSDGDMTYFSTYGEHIDIVSPGQDILSLRGAGTDMYDDPNVREPEVRIVDSLYYLADGTSMATPIVAGAAALLWGFRPDLSLDELIGYLLEGATDLVDPLNRGDTLVGPDTLSGYGYLNVGASLSLVQTGGLYLAEPINRQRYTEPITVKAGVMGGYTGSWQLEYAVGPNPSVWSVLASGASVPADSVLYVFDDPAIEGFVTFRLVDANGHSSSAMVTHVRRNVLEITGPTDGAEIEYSIAVMGSAYGPDYDSMTVSYRRPGGGAQLLRSSTGEYFDSMLVEWSVSGSDTGDFTIYLSGFFGATVAEDSVQVRVASAFAAGWPQMLPGYGGMTPVPCDLNGDGIKELAVTSSLGLVVYRGDNGALVDGFPVLGGRDCRCVPAVYDIDGDGLDEIIVTDSVGLHAFNGDGTYVDGWPQPVYTGVIPYEYGYPNPVVAQLRSGSPAGAVPDTGIIFINKIGQVMAYRFNGDRYFYSRELFGQFDARVSFSSGMGGSASPFVTASDITGDGRIEVVASFTSPRPYTGLGLFDGANGQPALGMDSPTIIQSVFVTGTVLADLNQDGRAETIMSGLDTTYNQWVWITTDGTTEYAGWMIDVSPYGSAGWISSFPVAADLDLDGVPEILLALFGYDRGSVYIYRADGTPYISGNGLAVAEAFRADATFGTPAVADLIGDEHPEIVFRSGYLLPGTGREQVYILDYAAEPIPGWPKETPARPNEVFSSRYAPLIDDIDGDGKVELVLNSDSREVLVWDFPASSNGGENHSRFLADDRNSGTLRSSGTAPGPDRMPALSAPGELSQRPIDASPFYPVSNVSFRLPAASWVRLEIYNLLGRRVEVLLDGNLEAGEHTVAFDGGYLARGVYFYRLLADGRAISAKMLLID